MTTPKKTRKSAHNNKPNQKRPTAKPTKKPRRSTKRKEAEGAVRPGTKQATLIALLKRPEGVTIAQMCTKSGWQAHSIRAALTGLRKRGISISRDKNDAGITTYRVLEAAK